MLENKGQGWRIILLNTFRKGPFVGRNLVHHGSLCKVPLIYLVFPPPVQYTNMLIYSPENSQYFHVVYHFCSQMLASLVEMKWTLKSAEYLHW